jgi:hypothetical protein
VANSRSAAATDSTMFPRLARRHQLGQAVLSALTFSRNLALGSWLTKWMARLELRLVGQDDFHRHMCFLINRNDPLPNYGILLNVRTITIRCGGLRLKLNDR